MPWPASCASAHVQGHKPAKPFRSEVLLYGSTLCLRNLRTEMCIKRRKTWRLSGKPRTVIMHSLDLVIHLSKQHSTSTIV